MLGYAKKLTDSTIKRRFAEPDVFADDVAMETATKAKRMIITNDVDFFFIPTNAYGTLVLRGGVQGDNGVTYSFRYLKGDEKRSVIFLLFSHYTDEMQRVLNGPYTGLATLSGTCRIRLTDKKITKEFNNDVKWNFHRPDVSEIYQLRIIKYGQSVPVESSAIAGLRREQPANYDAPVAQADAAPVVQADAAPVAQADATPVAQAEAAPAVQVDAAQADATPVAQAEAASVVQADAAPVAQADATPVAQAEAAPVAQADATPIAQLPPIANQPDSRPLGVDVHINSSTVTVVDDAPSTGFKHTLGYVLDV
ncbi:hypothetical protein BC937DRAFT_92755 [Endogone sp. FLAS-F59071]|nr:hypothetical protein BC937DRAFT_92755 [Endogone sp. FLAS-F59071]|eukprot:RUS21420.1 hypothetical protein BC937DRAFT_92755 [Endogone sp. FLAS-F59071]